MTDVVRKLTLLSLIRIDFSEKKADHDGTLLNRLSVALFEVNKPSVKGHVVNV